MIDYQSLRALEAVIENQNFEIASQKLNISQSAVSQRIQSFESYLGQKLLIRKSPYRATDVGENYLKLLRKVSILESEIVNDRHQKPTVKIAINRDSLDLFFLKVLSDSSISKLMSLQIIADDQDETLKYIKSGQVDLCISSKEKPLPNHISTKIGDMKYTLVCSKSFHNKYFISGVSKKTLSKAPLVTFDRFDKLQHTYIKEQFKTETFQQINSMPSVLSFKQAILGGFGYGLVPFIDIQKELKKKQLVQLNPSKDFFVPLYIHQWEYQLEHMKFLTKKITKVAEVLK